jgi:hypothetical protein
LFCSVVLLYVTQAYSICTKESLLEKLAAMEERTY